MPRVAFRGNSYLQVNSSTFGQVDGALLVGSFTLTARRFRSRLLHLVDDLAAGRTNVHRFNLAAARLIRTEFGIAYALGALSIDPFHNLTPRDIRVINQELEQERRFLRAFARDISTANLVLGSVQRAGLYLQALRGMFELGRMEALPDRPLTWVLGPTEHCLSCVNASLGGPYQRDTYSYLGLPVLPGIPGSGDICRGLTNCGCFLTLQNLPLHNEGIQSEVKYALSEIIHDSS
jgi:hypothetical protein